MCGAQNRNYLTLGDWLGTKFVILIFTAAKLFSLSEQLWITLNLFILRRIPVKFSQGGNCHWKHLLGCQYTLLSLALTCKLDPEMVVEDIYLYSVNMILNKYFLHCKKKCWVELIYLYQTLKSVANCHCFWFVGVVEIFRKTTRCEPRRQSHKCNFCNFIASTVSSAYVNFSFPSCYQRPWMPSGTKWAFACTTLCFYGVCPDDRNGEWQALEGLSTIAFKQRRVDRCCELLRRAIIAASTEQLVVVNESPATVAHDVECANLEPVRQRLVDKLTIAVSMQSRARHDQVIQVSFFVVCLHIMW